ncbi:MAG TPA: group I intron-associated PD-(D/E)XK endonuclease [Methylomirabilota bacterium]|nr:group I intron-associated PD-(D/E)XK endonuclease [Methylomirabilota bacterium]
MPKDTTTRGELSELEVAMALARSGRKMLRPMSSGLRYDLAIDNGDGTVARIQCKTGILRDGVISFNVASMDGRRPYGVPYLGQIEAFGVFCPQNGKVYLVPIDRLVAKSSKGRLRIAATRNGQSRGVILASTFEVALAEGQHESGS